MKNNVLKIYTYTFFRLLIFILSVFIPFVQSYGLSMKEVFEILAIFNLSMVLFDVPAGYLCDIIGRKKTLLMGSFTAAAGYTSLCFADSYLELAAVYFVVAIGFSLISGADIAFIYESLEHLPPEKRVPHRIIARQQLLLVLSEAIAAIIGGHVAEHSMRTLAIMNAVAAWVPFFIAFSFKEPLMKRSLHQRKNFFSFLGYFKKLFAEDKTARMIFSNWVFWSFSTYTAIWILQKSWSEKDLNMIMFGYLWALCNVSVGVFGHAVESLQKSYGTKFVLVLIGLGPVLGYFGTTSSELGIALGMSLLFYMSRGMFNVSLRELFNSRITHEYRATGNSLISFSMRLLFFVISPIIGWGIDKRGSAFVSYGLGLLCVAAFVCLLIPLIKNIEDLPQKTG